jgi:catechol-2,3-dioxygenase
MPGLLGVLETSLYVEEFERTCPFYEQVLGLNSIYRDQRLCAYDVGSRGVLLLFLRGRSLETVQLPGGTIPPHDGSGPVHIAFSIAADELAAWGSGSRRRTSPSKVAPNGHAAARVSISATPGAGDTRIVAGILR